MMIVDMALLKVKTIMRKINISILIFIVLISCFRNLWAQESDLKSLPEKPYSLDDLYQIALKRSEKIKISEEDLYITERIKEKALSVLVPRFSAFGNYTRYNEEKTTADTGTLIQPESTTAWGVRFDQSFTLNGKELIALGIAEDSIKKSKYDLDAVKEAYLFNVASAYYDVLKTETAVNIAMANVKRLEAHKNAVTVQLKIEAVTKTALYRAQAELSKSKAELIKSKNRLRLTRNVLSRVVGLEGNFKIKTPEFKKDFSLDNDMDSVKKEALFDRAELKSLAVQKKISEDTVKYFKSAYWPSVSVEGVYQKYDQEPDSLMVNDESISVGVLLNFTIFDGGLRKAEIKESLAKKRQAELAEKELSKEIATQVDDAYLYLHTQMSVLKSLEDQLNFANDNYNAVSKQFKYGLSNSIDLMDANTLLVTSETELSKAIYNRQLAGLNVERAKGTFLKAITGRLEVKTER
ncbi:MAG: TolC family protein [Deltaproteobacteria bacterium]|nr:TolC family protein [Deltaproteobacteria bacterium]